MILVSISSAEFINDNKFFTFSGGLTISRNYGLNISFGYGSKNIGYGLEYCFVNDFMEINEDKEIKYPNVFNDYAYQSDWIDNYIGFSLYFYNIKYNNYYIPIKLALGLNTQFREKYTFYSTDPHIDEYYNGNYWEYSYSESETDYFDEEFYIKPYIGIGIIPPFQIFSILSFDFRYVFNSDNLVNASINIGFSKIF